jgi:hypothetical protein
MKGINDTSSIKRNEIFFDLDDKHIFINYNNHFNKNLELNNLLHTVSPDTSIHIKTPTMKNRLINLQGIELKKIIRYL